MNLIIVACLAGNYDEVDNLMKHRGLYIEIRDMEFALTQAARQGFVEIVDRLLKDVRIDPSANSNHAIRIAAMNGHLPVIERLLQDGRVDPSEIDNNSLALAAYCGHLAVVERLLRDKRVDPSARRNEALGLAAMKGHHAVVDRLLREERVDPSTNKNFAIRMAANEGHFNLVDRLLDDKRTSLSGVLDLLPKEKAAYFEYRKRFTEICIALQSLSLPAWITMLIIKASYPWNILPIHNQWKLVCAVKHFHNRRVSDLFC